MSTDSLKKRYIAKLSTNMVGLVVGLAIEMIIPRSLGPKNYGNFTFLTNFFQQIATFLDAGTFSAFYTKLSKRNDDFGLVPFYLFFSVVVSLLIFLFVIGAHATTAYRYIFPDQGIYYIYLASIFGVLTWFVQVLQGMADAYGVTVSAEFAKIVQKGLGLMLILILFFSNQLSFTTIFYYYYFTLLFLVIAFIVVLDRKGHTLIRSWKLSYIQVKKYTKEFYSYSHPLFVLSSVVMLVAILDRWLLQYFGGSVQQGFFGLSYKIGAICFLFSRAMTQLLTREFAIAFEKNRPQEIAKMFRRYAPPLYSIAAFFSCFIAVQADRVAYIFGGKMFGAASVAVMIMAFFPINQTFGQIVNAVFYATDQTRLYRNIGIGFALVGLPMTYFLVANVGLNLGASGLAIKMVTLQFVSVNVRLFFSTRYLKLNFWKYFGYQIVNVTIFLVLAFIARFSIDWLLVTPDVVLQNFMIEGVVYTILAGGLLMVFPISWGLTHADIQPVKRIVFRKLS